MSKVSVVVTDSVEISRRKGNPKLVDPSWISDATEIELGWVGPRSSTPDMSDVGVEARLSSEYSANGLRGTEELGFIKQTLFNFKPIRVIHGLEVEIVSEMTSKVSCIRVETSKDLILVYPFVGAVGPRE
ncbi:hypothetical protein PM082_007798 [Marasmius tenuissimus]|nr:hypothetical protein PM082_007798 [Marasmius tenuissimus]